MSVLKAATDCWRQAAEAESQAAQITDRKPSTENLTHVKNANAAITNLCHGCRQIDSELIFRNQIPRHCHEILTSRCPNVNSCSVAHSCSIRKVATGLSGAKSGVRITVWRSQSPGLFVVAIYFANRGYSPYP